MSVYTSISDNEFSEILKLYNLGNLICSQGIQAGIENTNYFITTTKGEYVFTLFEKINQQELELYISLLQELSVAGIACPQPKENINKKTISEIKNKPFTIVSRLRGKNISSVNPRHCKAIAIELANLHTTPLSVYQPANNTLQNRRGNAWRERTAKNLLGKLSTDDANLISNELEFYKSFDDSKLPKGIIHADLFKDNALFEGDHLSGIIDFYDACYDNYLYDVAITINAWCSEDSGRLNKNLESAFLHAYQSLRPFTDAELKAWPIMLRMAAVRFWLSRLEDALIQREGDLTHRKDPNEYQRILKNHIPPLINRVAQ